MTDLDRNHPANSWWAAELVVLGHNHSCQECAQLDCPEVAAARQALAVHAPGPRPDLTAADPAVLRHAVLVARGLIRRHTPTGDDGRCRICATPGCGPVTAASALLTSVRDPWYAERAGQPDEQHTQLTGRPDEQPADDRPAAVCGEAGDQTDQDSRSAGRRAVPSVTSHGHHHSRDISPTDRS